MFFTPLEQFEILLVFPVNFFGLFDLSITNMTVYILLVCLIISFFLWFTFLYNPEFIPVRFQLIFESLYKFVLDMAKQQAGPKAIRYFPLLLFTFMVIIFSNLIGLIPYSFTVTSHISIVLALAFSFNVAMVFIGFYYNGLKFLMLFVPGGTPAALLPLVVVIEFFSYLIRTVSLSIRLFANMTAGHTLLHMLVSFALTFLNANAYLMFIFASLLTFAILILEFGIAFLQAYIFVILLFIYLNDSFHPSH
jgi:ATP synthase subunit 6